MKRFKKVFAAAIAAVLTVSSAPGLETPISKLFEKSNEVSAENLSDTFSCTFTKDGKFETNYRDTTFDESFFEENIIYDESAKTLTVKNYSFFNSSNESTNPATPAFTSEMENLTIIFQSDDSVIEINSCSNANEELNNVPALKVAAGTTIKCAEGTTLSIKAKDGCNAIESEGSLNIADADIYACDMSNSYPQTPITASGDITITNSKITATSITSTTKITADNAIMYGAGKIKFGDNDEEWKSGTTKSITNEQINANDCEKVFYFNNYDIRNFGLHYDGGDSFVVQYSNLNLSAGNNIQTPVPGIEIQTKENGDKKLVLDNCTFENSNEDGGVLFITNWENAEIEVKGKNRLISSQVVISASDIKFTGIGSDASLCLDSANTLCMYAPSITFENLDITAYKRLDDYPAIISGPITAEHAVVENGAEKFVSGTSTSLDAKEVGKSVTLHAGTVPYYVSSGISILSKTPNEGFYTPGVDLDIYFYAPKDNAVVLSAIKLDGGEAASTIIAKSDKYPDANYKVTINGIAPKDMTIPLDVSIEIIYDSANSSVVPMFMLPDDNFCMASALADIYYDDTKSQQERDFAKAMILYGARAQEYFKTRTDNLATKWLKDSDISWTSEETAIKGVKDYTGNVVDGCDSFIGQTLNLNSCIDVNSYFDLSSYELQGTTFRTFPDGRWYIKDEFNGNDKIGYIMNGGLTPENFGTVYEGYYTINDLVANKTYEYNARICVYDYVHTILNGENYDNGLKALCCEIYNVGEAGKAFANS